MIRLASSSYRTLARAGTLVLTVCLGACATAEPGDEPSAEPPAAEAADRMTPRSLRDPPVEAPLVDRSDPANAYLRAVARLDLGACTGAFVQTSRNDDAPAYVLTAGHCALFGLGTALFGPSHAQVVIVDREFNGNDAMSVEFDGLTERLRSRRVAFATMKGKDVALLELPRTIGQLKAEGIMPLPLSETSPKQGDDIEISGIPAEYDGGEYLQKELRRARCKSDRRANLVESHWYFRDVHAGRCQGLGPGASGAPALDAQGKVFGVFSTHFGALRAHSTCFQNAPCEVGHGRPERGVAESFYAGDVVGLAKCFDDKGALALGAAACPLDPGVQAEVVQSNGLLIRRPRTDKSADAWNVSLTSPTLTHYRYKTGLLATLDCSDERSYTPSLPLTDRRLVDEPLPAREGLYGMCIVASDATTAQSLAYPSIVVQHVRSPRPPPAGLEPKNVSPFQALDLAHAILPHFAAHARAHGATLTVSYDPRDTTRIAIEEGRRWRILIGLDAFRQDVTSPDVMALILCHEVGHALGGFPFKLRVEQAENFEKYGTVSATEGQADYFATKECLPRVWQADRIQNARARRQTEPYAKERCDAAWPDTKSRDLCHRSALAAEAFGRWRVATRPEAPPALETPSEHVALGTEYEAYPTSTQCRVDTMFQGALCKTKARGTSIPGIIMPYERLATIDPEVEKAAEPDACLEGPGARPRCWFKPNMVKFDCSEFGEASQRCAEVDGKSVMQFCSTSGVETTPCWEGTTCAVDSDEFVWCREVATAP